VINKAAASLLFPGRSAIGGRFTVGSNPDRVLEVIGVVNDTRDVQLEQKPGPRMYWQYASGGAQILIRSSKPPAALIPMVRETIRQTDSRILSQKIQTMSEIVSATVAERRFLMSVLTVYAFVALGIAMVGIGGVVGCQVAQRTNEFGVRIALGSTRPALFRLILLQVGKLVALGLVAGLAVSFATNRLFASQLFNLSPTDPALLAVVSFTLFAVALGASLVPARRAARVDPLTALRYE
jgi:putative ABC transport system permease protein